MIWKKSRKLIVTALFFLIIGGIYFFVIPKLKTRIDAQKKQFQETMAIQEYQRQKLRDIQKVKDDFELAGKEEEKIPLFLDKNKAVDFIQEIEKLSEGTNNRAVIEVVPSGVPAKGKASTKSADTILGNLQAKDYLQFNIKTAGSFLGLIKFINQLENSKYYLDIFALRINFNSNGDKVVKTESQEKVNPFSAANQSGITTENKSAQSAEEVVASISVVVYTQGQ